MSCVFISSSLPMPRWHLKNLWLLPVTICEETAGGSAIHVASKLYGGKRGGRKSLWHKYTSLGTAFQVRDVNNRSFREKKHLEPRVDLYEGHTDAYWTYLPFLASPLLVPALIGDRRNYLWNPIQTVSILAAGGDNGGKGQCQRGSRELGRSNDWYESRQMQSMLARSGSIEHPPWAAGYLQYNVVILPSRLVLAPPCDMDDQEQASPRRRLTARTGRTAPLALPCRLQAAAEGQNPS